MTATPAPSRREREEARHRKEILAVALRLFADKGYHETTMQMIAEAAEFSVGYLYKHFAGKEDMYRALLEEHVAKLREIEEECARRDLAPLDELRQSFEAICEHFNHFRGFLRIYHMACNPGPSGLEERKQKRLARMEELFRWAMERGELRPVNPRLLAAAVQGASIGLFRELATRDDDQPFADLTDILFELLIDGKRIT